MSTKPKSVVLTETTEGPLPAVGQVVHVRTRTYLVEAVEHSAEGTLVRLACLDDDAQGQQLEVIWEIELDTKILDREAFKSIGKAGFDHPRVFSAYVHTLRWNCVTATDPRLFQSPFRAGIRLDAYQLEPLRKALLLPRVNLFIADDVGLGKTIEAGLIASELLLRRRVREIVVVCPPSMLIQWKDELEARFGLTFEILDRAYVERVRQERGYGVNPWTTFPRFLISERLLIDETYAGPLRDWLDNLRPGSLLILDEAHHAAPSSGAKYAIDSRITKAIRELAPRFEHRLFLSATPHNGHSNSFSALLELLDPQRFTRGVKVVKSNLDGVMVRRLKEDLRQIVGGFPVRKVVQVDLKGLPPDTPEIKLSKLLDEYRQVRLLRMAGATKHQQAAALLVISHLQQRLLSSVEAFARTLAVHRRSMEKIWAAESGSPPNVPTANETYSHRLLEKGLDNEDDRSQLPEEEQQKLFDRQVEAATEAMAGNTEDTDIAREQALLTEMEQVAEIGRNFPDARIRYLMTWIREHMCLGARIPGEPCPQPNAKWTDLRLLIFTEWDDTKRYLVEMLRASIADTDMADVRIEVFHGPTPPDKREAIKHAFNEHPHKNPLRILVATDAAREGINLQAHCHNLFHFDVPWNPSRLEQRNGRIDRKLQPAQEVFCHYFFYEDRPEDSVLQALVRKTEIIRRELGSLAQVLEERLADAMCHGIRHADASSLKAQIEGASVDPNKLAVTKDELETARERQDDLKRQIDLLANRINDSRKGIGLEADELRDALSCSLELLNIEPLKRDRTSKEEPIRYCFPVMDDPGWNGTLDTLRALPRDGKRSFQWRKDSHIRPVVFSPPEGIDDEIVHLHLSHRVVQRLLGRFLAQGFIHHDLSRACLTQSTDAIPRVVLLGRLSLYGPRAVRLHEEILTVTVRWVEPSARRGPLTPYGREAESRTIELLEESLRPNAQGNVPESVKSRLQNSIPRDMDELLPVLEKRGHQAKSDAEAALAKRGKDESDAIRKILEDQKRRVESQLLRAPDLQTYLNLGQNEKPTDEEKRQYDSNRKYWQRWLTHVEADIMSEPGRILDFYRTTSFRIEPIGLAYLWPVSG